MFRLRSYVRKHPAVEALFELLTLPGRLLMGLLDRLLDVSDRVLALVMIAPAAILIVLFAIYPTLQGGYVSFFNVNYATLETSWVGLQNYERLLSDDAFWNALWRTIVLVVTTVSVQLVLGMLLSLLLHQQLVGRNIARGLVLFPYLVPAIVIAVTWRFMLDPTLGIVNRLLQDADIISRPIAFFTQPDAAFGMVIFAGIWKYTPFMIIMFLARLQVIPPELTEAAQLDGANPWQIFWNVTLPWMMPVIIVALLLRTIWTFNEFEMVYLFAFGGPLDATTTLPVLVRQLAFDDRNLGEAAAVATLMVMILIVMAWGYFRLYDRAERDLQ